MLLNIDVPVKTVKEPMYYYINVGDGRQFPMLFIDVDSYIVQARIESGLNYSWDEGVYNLQIGKYTSIAEGVLFIIDINHDYKSVFQGVISVIEQPKREEYRIKRKGQIIIQNDCWIGHGATIMSGVTIHNGAIVGANSTVTKDVPPYAIVGGNPAKIIGYRFDKDIISKLQCIQWWDWSAEDIKLSEADLRADINTFVNKYYIPEFENELKSKVNPVMRISDGELYVFFVDIDYPFALYEKVINQFRDKFKGTNNELLLYLNPIDASRNDNLNKLSSLFQGYKSNAAHINLYTQPVENDAELLAEADYYITNRLPENISRMNIAELLGIGCISGVDGKIFN